MRGYSVIRLAPLLYISGEKINADGKYQLDIMINKEIENKDSFNIRNIVDDIENKNICDFNHQYLYNEHVNSFEKIDYDYYASNQGRGFSCSKVLPYFLNEKLKSLTEEEKKVMSNYRNFDLDRMLTDDSSKDYLLNSDNAGVIVVGEEVYQSTVKKMQHGSEFDSILSEISKRGSLFKNSSFTEMVGNPEFIFISLYFKNIVIWANEKEKMSDFQKEYLKSLAHHLKDLNQDLKEKGDSELINVSYCSNGIAVLRIL